MYQKDPICNYSIIIVKVSSNNNTPPDLFDDGGECGVAIHRGAPPIIIPHSVEIKMLRAEQSYLH